MVYIFGLEGSRQAFSIAESTKKEILSVQDKCSAFFLNVNQNDDFLINNDKKGFKTEDMILMEKRRSFSRAITAF